MGYIAIVDYGVGNLKSVANAMQYLGFQISIAAESESLERADAIILPGVGAFPDAANKLRESGVENALTVQAEKKPVLGICLGMQLLFDMGYEGRPCAGLGLIPGKVDRLQTTCKLPHIGWNSLTFQNSSPIFKGLKDGERAYFVHSFCAYADVEADVTARTEYETSVVAAVGRGNLFGCQFHPEKSGEMGLRILRNFGELNQ